MAGRPALNIEKYRELAAERNMELLLTDEDPVPKVRDVIEWKCLKCGTIHRTSYNSLKYVTKNGCRCARSLPRDAYHRFAEDHGIQWVGQMVPPNTKTETHWISKQGIPFTASHFAIYRNLTAIRAFVNRKAED